MGGRRRNHKKPKDEKRILVQSLSETFEGGYPLIQFHLVDLKLRLFKPNYSPSLLHFGSLSTMVSLSHFVYMFGCVDVQQPQTHIPLQRSFLGASRLDLSSSLDQSQRGMWSSTPAPVYGRDLPICTSLFGKIYTFGTAYLEPEVFDPAVGHWKPLLPLPPDLVGCKVSASAIQDSSNDRILVHLSGGQLSSSSLYAFKPPPDDDHSSGGTWTCFAPDFNRWARIAAVYDDVIYFHEYGYPSNLSAFDMATGTWLTVHWSSSFANKLDLNNTSMDFDALLPLGDGIMCLAVWSRVYDSDFNYQHATENCFAKFKVKRKRNHPTVTLNPISSQTYVLPATCEVQNFLAL